MTHPRVMPVFRGEEICLQSGTIHVHARVQHTRLENKYTALYTADTRPCTACVQRRRIATGRGTAIAHARVSLTAFARTFCLSKLRALK